MSLTVVGHMSRLQTERTRAERQLRCAQFLQYAITPGTLEMRLNFATWCRLRSCPVCTYIRSVKLRKKIIPALTTLSREYPEGRFIFLTLTVKNCHQSLLRETVESMQKGWTRFYKRNSTPFLGFLKTLEVTRPKECFYAGEYIARLGRKQIRRLFEAIPSSSGFDPRLWEEYPSEEVHPHYHVLALVDQSYFNEENYINHPGWVARWKLAMRLDYMPIVNIRRVYSYGEDEIVNAGLEATKYVLSPKDMLDPLAPFIFQQLRGKRLLDVGGIMRNYIQQGVIDSVQESMRTGEENYQGGVPYQYDWDDELGCYYTSRVGSLVYAKRELLEAEP